MKNLRFKLTRNFSYPWLFGPGYGWGCSWFDFGPFTLWWWKPRKKKG